MGHVSHVEFIVSCTAIKKRVHGISYNAIYAVLIMLESYVDITNKLCESHV